MTAPPFGRACLHLAWLLAALTSLVAGVCGTSGAKAAEDLTVMRNLQAVYNARSCGETTVQFPRMFKLNAAALRQAVERDAAANQIPAGRGKDAHTWYLLTADPEAYLEASADLQAETISNGPYQAGTAFVFRREGILFTNAHVIDVNLEEIAVKNAHDEQVVASVLKTPLLTLGATVVGEIGEPPKELVD
jgi:S1-C subfamily serine protease